VVNGNLSTIKCRSCVILALMLGALLGVTQDGVAQDSDAEVVAAVRAVFAGMSGDTGDDRDWRTWEGLFLPGARLVNVRGAQPAEADVRISSVPEWIVATGLNLNGVGFIEEVVHKVTEDYAGIASVFLTYQTRGATGGEITGRGAATLQLARTAEGWRVASWMWTGEKEGIPLP
jgi:hypothetical protein